MRRYLFLLAFLLVGCSGSDVEPVIVPDTGQPPSQPPAQHVPEITNLALAPDTVNYMDGDGDVVVTVEITFTDAGSDLQTLWVQMPDGTNLEFDETPNTETGTFAEDLTMSTRTIGTHTVEFWLVDQSGDRSDRVTARFIVVGNVQSGEWTRRLGGLPGPLYDVTWDGQVFVAVGYGGAIWTSVDGIDWVARESGTDTDLWAVTADGPDLIAVGAFIVLWSTDHGATWIAKARPEYVALTTVAVNSSVVVAIGGVPDLLFPKIMTSEDRGDTWQTGGFVKWPTDLIYRDELFVATTQNSVLVSSDGQLWNETLLHQWSIWGWLRVAVHDGRQFIVAGDGGTVYTSFDALNWMILPTPFEDVDYRSAAWDGSRVVLAGGVSYQYWQDGIYRPNGISSTDGGENWDIFNIGSNYESMGIAWGNGRFVSVGWTPLSDRGAIYTTD